MIAGPRNQLSAHGVLGTEEAIRPLAPLRRGRDPGTLDVLLDPTPCSGDREEQVERVQLVVSLRY
jgi:hypothetical protein